MTSAANKNSCFFLLQQSHRCQFMICYAVGQRIPLRIYPGIFFVRFDRKIKGVKLGFLFQESCCGKCSPWERRRTPG